jgi:hypothetical protein
VTQLQSGPPSTVNISGLDTNGDGSAFNDRPLLTSKSAPFDSTAIDAIYVDANEPGTYYDLKQLDATGAEVIVDPSTQHWTVPYGPQFLHQESGRNSFKNPGTTVWNMAVQKDIPLAHWESSALQLRAEVNNIGNHNDVNPLDVNLLHVGTSDFENISNARASTQRTLRFWAKFRF